jgi:peptidoglycan/xylan/chitin deacetylase (PgdA/CDA1 family)
MRDKRRNARFLAGLSTAACGAVLGAASLAQPATAATRQPAQVARPAKVAARAVTTGVASFTFDDGKISQYRNARPALIAAHLHGTFYIISDGLGWGTSSNMSPVEARQLVKDGDEIGNHTRDHSDLAELSDSEVRAEFADSQAAIKKQLGVTPTTCAYPYGSSSASARAIAAKFFRACRGTSSGTIKASNLAPYDLVTYYVHTDTSVADIQAAVNAAKAARSWVIFVYHGIGTVNSSDDITAAQFRAQVQAVKSSGIAVRTVSQQLTAFGR